MAPEQKVPVSVRALIARINRKLKSDYYNGDNHELLQVFVCKRSSQWFSDLGRYYMVDVATNWRSGVYLNAENGLEDYAKEIGVMKQHEYLKED